MIGSWLVLVGLAFVGIGGLRVETSTDSVLERDSEAWRFYQASIDRFGGDELIVVAFDAEPPFAGMTLQRVATLTSEIESIEGVRRVDSLASAPFIRGDAAGGVELSGAIENGVPRTDSARRALLEALAADRIAPAAFLSDDARVLALNVLLDAEIDRPYDDVVNDVRERAGRDARISGVPIFRSEINLRTASEIARFGAGTLLVILLAFRWLFGSWRSVLVPAINGAVGTVMLLGAMGALGVPLTLLTMILPSIVLALGCSYSSHYVYGAARAAGSSSEDDRSDAFTEVATPVLLSGLTTSIGFVAISVVPIEAMRELGALGAFGALAATFAAATLSPAILTPGAAASPTAFGSRVIGGVVSARLAQAQRYRGAILGVALLAAVIGALGLGWLRLETDATQWFMPNSPIRQAYDQIRLDLSGISPINVVIEAPPGGSVAEPEVVAALNALGDHLRGDPDVGKVLSIADPLLQIHEVFAGPGLPLDSKPLIEQYLLLLGSEEAMWDLIDRDYSGASVMVRAQDNGSEHLLALANRAESWWSTHGIPGYRARATGIMFEFARAEDVIVRGLISGLSLAVGCVALLLLLILRSARLAAAALIANVIPIAVAFGALGWLDQPLDVGTVLVANLALGIAVDDTIHVAMGLRERSGDGDGLHACLSRVLPALATTTIAVGGGFAVLAFSEFAFTRNLGLLTAVIMALCLIADVVLLPSLLSRRKAG